MSDRDCACVRPKPGPMYWCWRCLKCDGEIHGPVARWRLRRAKRKADA